MLFAGRPSISNTLKAEPRKRTARRIELDANAVRLNQKSARLVPPNNNAKRMVNLRLSEQYLAKSIPPAKERAMGARGTRTDECW
jgi:hypothetical protein